MNVKRTLIVLAIIAGAMMALAQKPAPPPPSKFKLSIAAFADGSSIPLGISCSNPTAASPALQWSGAPPETASFALILHDPDAAPRKASADVTHWIIWNIPGTVTQLAGGVPAGALPDGTLQGKNRRGTEAFMEPCPAVGGLQHHYTFEFYALDQKLTLVEGSSRDDLLKAMDGHVIAKAVYIGLLTR
jgi:Raf kinase inhibitor-like YbhB/YbcL family protein